MMAAPVAHAAFEFVAPSASQAPSAPGPVSDFVESIQQSPENAPGAAIESEALDMAAPPVRTAPTRIINQRADIALKPIEVPLTPVVKDSDALSIETQPFQRAPAMRGSSVNAMPAPIGLPTRFSDTGNMNEGGNVQGFGRGVPLAIALQQIVPASYRYSFEPPINPSMRISWSGDKPWKAVVADIARTNDMNVDIASNVVSFSRHKPMDIIAADSMGSSLPIAGQPVSNNYAPALPSPVSMAANDAPMAISAPPAAPATESAPAPVASSFDDLPPVAPVSAPVAVAANTNVPSAPLPAPSNISDLIYDGPSSGKSASVGGYGSQPSPAPRAVASSSHAMPEPILAPMPTPAAMPSLDGQRTALASISDAPLEPVSAPAAAPAPIPAPAPVAAPQPKSAFFDSLMDQGTPSNGTVKEKRILTAEDNMVVAQAASQARPSKPMDILDPKPLLAPSGPKPSSQSPKPAETTAIAPLPPIMGNAPTSIGKQIDNSPVTANELPAPAAYAPPVSAPLPNVQPDLSVASEWTGLKAQTLRQTLTAWAQQAGTSLVWSSEYDYPLQTDVRIQGSYTDAVRTLLDGFGKAEPRPIGRLYKNDKVGAQPVLIIETQRLTN